MNTIPGNTAKEKSFSLTKKERLSSKKIIDKLFAEGDSILQYPIKMVFLKTDLTAGVKSQAGFTASKRNFKRAIARNRIKRLLRESYRLNKHMVYSELNDEQLALFFIFIGKELPKYEAIELAMKKGLSRIIQKLNEN
ncbi:ribonuclease P protein component [Prolixibacteraceae bacterium Z1-6]|uniref:Ribonuclease P protein component n=1 Tax=Draconibacterium aestuarii TaxID=2998507 RepID=A0A9X3F7G6_9BACT|nr:ribonuclease P protein component [Prolixibacteraceae bacterium Z1-6]